MSPGKRSLPPRLAPHVSLIADVVAKWRRDKAEKLAASLAFYSVFAIAPMMMFGLALSNYVAERREATDFLQALSERLLGARAAESLRPVLESGGHPRGSATIIGALTLLFGASSTFFHLEDVVNMIWQAHPRQEGGLRDYVRRRIFSFLLVIAMTTLFLVAPTLTIVVSGLGRSQTAAALLSGVLQTLFFGTLFTVLPDTTSDWRDVWSGAALTAIAMTVAQWGMGFYLGRIAARSLYGGAGAFLALLFWMYISAQILLFGAEFVAVRSLRRADRP